MLILLPNANLLILIGQVLILFVVESGHWTDSLIAEIILGTTRGGQVGVVESVLRHMNYTGFIGWIRSFLIPDFYLNVPFRISWAINIKIKCDAVGGCIDIHWKNWRDKKSNNQELEFLTVLALIFTTNDWRSCWSRTDHGKGISVTDPGQCIFHIIQFSSGDWWGAWSNNGKCLKVEPENKVQN